MTGTRRSTRSLAILDVGLEEPQALVHVAADLGVEVGGALVAQLGGAIDRLGPIVERVAAGIIPVLDDDFRHMAKRRRAGVRYR